MTKIEREKGYDTVREVPLSISTLGWKGGINDLLLSIFFFSWPLLMMYQAATAVDSSGKVYCRQLYETEYAGKNTQEKEINREKEKEKRL